MDQSPHISIEDADFDTRLRAALHAAPTPVGLADRLLAALAVQGPIEAPSAAKYPVANIAPSDVSAAIPAARTEGLLVSSPRRDTKQMWFVRLATLAACALFAVGVWSHFSQPSAGTWGPERIMRLVRDFDAKQTWPAEPGVVDGWQFVGKTPPEGGLPSQANIAASDRWKAVQIDSLERQGIVVMLRGRAGEFATLYVFPYRGPPGSPDFASLPSFPEPAGLSTEGSTSFAWSDGESLFVLIAPGEPENAEQFLAGQGPLA